MKRSRCRKFPVALLRGVSLVLALGALIIDCDSARAQTDDEVLDHAAGWTIAFGAGLLLNAASTEGDEDIAGLGGHLSAAHPISPTLNIGVQWSTGWLAGTFTTHGRHELTLLFDRALANGFFRIRGGPGAGLVTVVTKEGGPFGPGQAGDLNVDIGGEWAWGGLLGVELRFPGPGHTALAGFGDVLYQRAAGFNVVTLLVGTRLVL